MRIKNGFLNLLNLLKNPIYYVAAIAGTVPGGISGAIVGAVSGAYLSPLFGFFTGYKDHQFGLDVDIFVGGAFGVIIGSVLGGGFTGSATLLKIYKNKKHVNAISKDNIAEILLPSLSASIELAAGMLVGGIIGSLKSLGFGTVLGAIIATLIILLSRPIIKIKNNQ
ncbi:hypothetical protein [Legionella gresilensis]|uniref:hypothetical protein n=1 Tax=Legionella gresilensis TaxID=91823 RepID=UPI001041AD04|nr:hypothetical protein [Legionella gresilensis]